MMLLTESMKLWGTSRRSHGLKLQFAASSAATLLLGSVVILASGNLQWHRGPSGRLLA